MVPSALKGNTIKLKTHESQKIGTERSKECPNKRHLNQRKNVPRALRGNSRK